MVSVLYHGLPCMKFSLDISFSWSDLLCFPFYIFPLLLCTAHVRRPSYLYLLFSEVVFSWVYLNLFFGLFSPCFLIHIFPQLCVRPLQTKTLLSCIPLSLSLFLWMILVTDRASLVVPDSCTVLWTCVHSSSGTLSTRSNPLNLLITSTVLS